MLANIMNVTHDNSTKKEILSECQKLRICGLILTFLFMGSLFSNSLIIWINCLAKELRKPIYFILICICVVNLIATHTELPVFIANLFNCG